MVKKQSKKVAWKRAKHAYGPSVKEVFHWRPRGVYLWNRDGYRVKLSGWIVVSHGKSVQADVVAQAAGEDWTIRRFRCKNLVAAKTKIEGVLNRVKEAKKGA